MGEIYNQYMELSLLVGVKFVHLADRKYLFKISKLVYVVQEIVMSLYGSLQRQRQRQTFYVRYSEKAGQPFVSVKLDGLGNFWNN